MSCTSPIPAIDLGIDKLTGKHKIKIRYPRIGESFEQFKHKYDIDGVSKVILLPCGHCLSCQMTKRKEWAIRCSMEAKYHQLNCFVTLTYDDEHCPSKLHKDDFQKFIHALHDAGFNVRYFGCGEYGSQTHRPHFHICLFGWMPPDLKKYATSKSENAFYVSETLNKYWKKGLAVVQYFDAKCGAYVAGYTSKKLGDMEGFILMSKRPGLGYQYLKDHQLDIAEFYRVVDSFGSYKEAKPPRYFDKICEQSGVDLTSIKDDIAEFARIARAVKYQQLKVDHINDIFQNQAYFDFKKASKLRRSL